MSEGINLVGSPESPEEIFALAAELRKAVNAAEISTREVLDGFESWASALGEGETAEIPGVQFLRL
jgi:hypothetical protein